MRNVVLVLLVAGCTGGTGGTAGGNVPKEQYNAEAYKAICAHYASCGIAKSTDTCFQYYQSLLGSYASVGLNFYDQAIEEKKIAYDGAAAARCLNGYASASCSLSALLTPAADCRSIYVGQVPVGSECRFGQCVPAAFCTSEVDGKCPGTCKARVQAGGAATSPAECEVGLAVVSGKCAQPPKEGEACASPGTFSGCAAGLTCASDSKTCVKPKIAGDACSTTSPCDIFYSCVNGKCTAPADVGEPCGAIGTSGLGCKLELYCNATGADGGTCAQRTNEGQPCTSQTQCNFDLRCSKATPSAADKTCHKPTALNGACTTTTDCETGLFCSTTSMTCIAQLEAGAACTAADSCKLGTCTAGKCVSYVSSICF